MAPAPKASPAAAGAVSGPVLYDARDRAKLPPGVEREPKLTPEIEKLVLSALSADYKSKREDCQGSEDVLFRVKDSATGAFTAPATKQTAYLVASGPCAAAGGDVIETTHLVVVDAAKVLAQATGKVKLTPGEPPPPFYGTDIRAVVDVDGDGMGEIFVSAESKVPAGVEEALRVFSAAGGAVKRVWSFAGVYKDGCGTGPTAKVQAEVVHYIPAAKDPTTRYPIEYFEAACPASGAPKVTDFQPLKPAAPAVVPGSPAASPGATAVSTPPSAATTPVPAPSPQPSP